MGTLLRRYFLISTATLFALLPASEKTRVAILPVEAKAGVEPSVALATGDLLSQELVNLRKFTVVERSRILQVMKEQSFQQSGCTEQSCAVKLGNLLNVQKMLAGSVTRLGSKHIIAVNLIDVERGQVEFAEKFSVDAVEDILQNITVLAQRMAERAQVYGTLLKQGEGQGWIVNLGLNDGVKNGAKLLVVRYGKAIVNQESGELLGRETKDLGEVSVVRVDPAGEFCTVKGGSDLREGDRVYLPGTGKSQEYVSSTPASKAAKAPVEKPERAPAGGGRSGGGDDMRSMLALDGMLKSKQFLRPDQKMIALALAAKLPQSTRYTLNTTRKMSPWGYFAANFFIFSLGSWIQGDVVAGSFIIGGIVLGGAMSAIGVWGNTGILAGGGSLLTIAAIANYGGPFFFATKHNKVLEEILIAPGVGALENKPSPSSREVRFQIPIAMATF